jgi:hypothetical protein
VEAQGGVRPEDTPGRDRQGVGTRAGEASRARCRFGVTRRERFEGEHPFVCWSPGRDGEIPVAGYAPSEHRLKRWPHEALSGAWCPPLCGRKHPQRFTLERVAEQDRTSSRPRRLIPAGPVAWIGASPDERRGVSRQSPVARAAADEQENYSLDNSFLRSRRSADIIQVVVQAGPGFLESRFAAERRCYADRRGPTGGSATGRCGSGVGGDR